MTGSPVRFRSPAPVQLEAASGVRSRLLARIIGPLCKWGPKVGQKWGSEDCPNPESDGVALGVGHTLLGQFRIPDSARAGDPSPSAGGFPELTGSSAGGALARATHDGLRSEACLPSPSNSATAPVACASNSSSTIRY